MKKFFKKFTILSFTALTLIFNIIPVNASVNENKNNKEYEEYLERNWSMVQLATKVEKKIKDYYNIEKTYEDEYPSYFGGIYINDDATSLIIQIVKENIPLNNTEEYNFYNELINLDNSIEIEYVENSFNALNDINNHVGAYIMSKESYDDNLTGAYIDVMNNTTIIELVDNTEEQQEAIIKEVFGLTNYSKFKAKSNQNIENSLITFRKSEEASSHQNINAGAEISVGQFLCSMGFRTTYNGKKGYVTAGHCVKGLSSVQAGYVRLAQYSNNERYDYGFVETYSSYTPTNTLAYSSGNVTKLGLVNYCPVITVNMEIAKSGMKTGYTSGKVQGLNQTIEYTKNNITLKGMVKSNVKCDNGDSGSPVFIPRTDANGGAIPVGILSGGSTGILGIGRTMYFTDISDLPSELQSGRY